VDYKTGNVTGTDLAFSDWNEIISDSKKSALFQVLLYHYILKAEFPDQGGVAGVIPLKNFENTFLVASKKISYNTKEPLLMNAEAYDAFEHELFKLISQIYDPSLPFIFK
jgi:hypothetical protein